jgi:hypothetical protein
LAISEGAILPHSLATTAGPGSTTGIPRRPIPILSVEVVDFGPEVTEDAINGADAEM